MRVYCKAVNNDEKKRNKTLLKCGVARDNKNFWEKISSLADSNHGPYHY